MSDPLLDDHQFQAPETEFQRLTQQLLVTFGATWLFRALASQAPFMLLINLGVKGMNLLLLVVCIRVLPYFREAPYPRVTRYAQMVYVGFALIFVTILININGWHSIGIWADWLHYGLLYGGIALLLVEYYSGFSIHKKATHWRQLYTLVVAWIVMAVFMRARSIMMIYYINDFAEENMAGATFDWLMVGSYILVAVLSWFRYAAKDSSDMRLWAVGYSLVMVLLFMVMEAQTLPIPIRGAALLGAALVGVPLGALLIGRKT